MISIKDEKLHSIEIPDLPEGWEPVAYRFPLENKDYVFVSNQIILCVWPTRSKHIIVRKKQPRRIVLEETGQVRKPMEGEYVQNNGSYYLCRKPERWGNEHEIWKIVEDGK